MKLYQKAAILSLLFALTLTAYGCKSKLSEPELDELNLKYELAEDETLEPFYASETKIYATVNKRKPSMSAPSFGAETEKFIVYDIASEKVAAQYDPEEDGKYIYHAIPFENGILYAIYTPPESIDESIKWDIKYISDEGSKVLDSGLCSSQFSMLPGFTVLDGDVYYLYEDYHEKTGYGFGIKKADLNEPQLIVEEKARKLSDTEFCSNGTDYALLSDGKILIGNAEGIYREYDLPNPMSDYGICKDYLFCCTESDGNKWTARSISLKTGKEYTAETEKPLFRIASMSGNELTCILENWEMCTLRPGREFEIVFADVPDEILVGRRNVRYYPYSDRETLAQLDETKFCRMTW